MFSLNTITSLFDNDFNWFGAIGLNNATTMDCWQVVIGVLSLGVALFVAIIAWRTYRVAEKVQETIASNHAKQKQVEVMYEFNRYLGHPVRLVQDYNR